MICFVVEDRCIDIMRLRFSGVALPYTLTGNTAKNDANQSYVINIDAKSSGAKSDSFQFKLSAPEKDGGRKLTIFFLLFSDEHACKIAKCKQKLIKTKRK